MTTRDHSPRRALATPPRWHADWLSVVALAQTLSALAPQLRGKRMLDIGCGNKPYRAFFPHAQLYIGVDIAQSNAANEIVSLTDDLPFAANTFDCAICTQVLEHVAEPARLLAEAFRTLTPNGVLLLAAPMYWPHHEEPYDFFRYTRYGLEYLVTNAGFEILQMQQQGGAWLLTGQALANTLQGITRRRTFGLRALSLLTINAFFHWLDRINYQSQDTCNFVVLARKIAER